MLTDRKIDAFKDFCEHASKYENFEFGQGVEDLIDGFARELLVRFVGTDSNMFLNFVGFGAKDLMGGRVELRIRNFYRGRLRFKVTSSGSEDPKDYHMWFPFAQQDAIGSFMWGVDNNSRMVLRQGNRSVHLLTRGSRRNQSSHQHNAVEDLPVGVSCRSLQCCCRCSDRLNSPTLVPASAKVSHSRRSSNASTNRHPERQVRFGGSCRTDLWRRRPESEPIIFGTARRLPLGLQV